jgi:MFS family permease
MLYNLVHEIGYCVGNGVVSGLALLSQVTVVGSLRGGEAAITLVTAAMPASALSQPLWAALARRFRLQTIALVSGVARCLPLVGLGLVSSSWSFAALIVLYYFAASPLSLAVSSLYKYNYPDSHRGRIIGLFRLVQNGLAIPVMLGGAWLLDQDPERYRLLYPLGGLVGFVTLFFYARLRIPQDLPRERARLSEPPSWRSIRTVLHTDRNFRLFQMTIFLTGAGFLMSRGILIYLLRSQFGQSQLQMTLLVQVLPIVLGGVTAPAWGAFIDRTSPVAGRVAFACLGMFAYAALFGSFYGNWLWLIYVGSVLRGLVLGAAEVATTAGNLYFSVRQERAALYESISAMFQGVRGLLMPALGLLLFRQIHAFLFLVPTALNVWSLGLALRLWRLDRQETPGQAFARRGTAVPLPSVEREADADSV